MQSEEIPKRQTLHRVIPLGIDNQIYKTQLKSNRQVITHRSLSTSSGLGRRWKPVAPRMTSKPRHIVVETEELKFRKELPKSATGSRDDSEPFSFQLASTSASKSSAKSAAAAEPDMGTGRDAEEESFRVSAAWIWKESAFSSNNRGERIGEGDRAWLSR